MRLSEFNPYIYFITGAYSALPILFLFLSCFAGIRQDRRHGLSIRQLSCVDPFQKVGKFPGLYLNLLVRVEMLMGFLEIAC